MSEPEKLYRVGQLAELTGLTVRTLHHYDDIGLLSPSRRSGAGYRLYNGVDVERLYEILALRQLGLSLEQIACAITGETSLEAMLVAHADHVDTQLAAMQRLQTHMATVLATVRRADRPTDTDLLDLIRRVMTVDARVENYFDADQLAALAVRREELGEEQIRAVENRWPSLIAEVDAAITVGMDPTSEEAAALAAEWMGLLEQFHGGDPGLRDGMYRMQEENTEEIQRDFGGPTPEQIDFIARANDSRN
ncbi:MerR family transcriptional regulator [Williamsia phyllosphaerae]|uniref:MerR family transcriptional regulator n=1 Tax=Williamsia phyllosphaerae TaxID=885042 RepID=A0ABQ1UAC6_9NOCA|nr:MerR family transcriptional regulator [Williamsia phyllosphaerae]GGF12584.1 MerR family transcriptional regulator [Williamsia phyllosphaerae]